MSEDASRRNNFVDLLLERNSLKNCVHRKHSSPVLWIRIRTKLKGKIVDQVDPDPHQFADDKPKCMEYEPFSLSRFLEAKIRIRNLDKVR